MRSFRKRVCGNKVPYSTTEEAQRAADATEFRYGKKMNVYVCRFCHFWHVGSLKSGY